MYHKLTSYPLALYPSEPLSPFYLYACSNVYSNQYLNKALGVTTAGWPVVALQNFFRVKLRLVHAVGAACGTALLLASVCQLVWPLPLVLLPLQHASDHWPGARASALQSLVEWSPGGEQIVIRIGFAQDERYSGPFGSSSGFAVSF
jgi:hypothetical protein